MTGRSRRSVADVDAALASACSRRTLAVQHREKALAAIKEADDELLVCQKHMEILDRTIAGLLDERIQRRAEQAEKIATG